MLGIWIFELCGVEMGGSKTIAAWTSRAAEAGGALKPYRTLCTSGAISNYWGGRRGEGARRMTAGDGTQ